ncbi:MAG: DNA topoisomerase I [Elusimicrobia bacterium RIFCSPLOWO2_02_FULL_39_32]|nr:MAG: DNA topoisomerase I [Elusimicrobia bacterium RIFCSPHIGHO2_02_FULL_39_36]OGR92326.1 MAG: DNA topoisomerase I [Elusimicrobia bacterium RIFCSPLOWO2_02_FULL_39_32]OGR98869.1 MAG: DNA topoisomerase I [Elusimicrobia bacterium RIFCSPLOWO2_12_FULL_39_28]
MSGSKKTKDLNLVIVESPTKEKTLSKFLGKKFVVKSSFGHLRDLPKKKFGIDIEDGFNPTYEVLPRGKKIIPDLKKAAQASSLVYLATDYDREGEAIAWHLSAVLDLPQKKVQRITFHEITPSAIQAALESPRKIDQRLVDSQVARRVLDRIVGYRLSPLLWEKVKRGLSAGRVQSIAVRFICDRETEIENFKSQEYWTIAVELENTADQEKIPFLAQLVEWQEKKIQKLDVSSNLMAQELQTELERADYKIQTITYKEKRRSPYPPYMTSTLAQDASRKIGFSAKKTMSVAQSLYEGVEINQETVGLITYMRTDSLNVSADAQKETKKFIEQKFGEKSLPPKPRFYKTKAKAAQEAHEAIHPTSVFREPEGIKKYLTLDQLKLYDLIWKRFLASQMADAVYDTVTVEIEAIAKDKKGLLRTTGSTLKESGFLIVYGEEPETEENQDKNEASQNKKLPKFKENESLKFIKVLAEQHFTEPPPRYNEASLIKILEQNGIGRPSTYAPIIDTILSRGYVRLQERRFHPTELGKIVNQQLLSHFPEIVDTQFTAKIEEKLDQIAEGEIAWNLVVKEFYDPFEKDLKSAETQMQKISVEPKDSGEVCELCKGKMLIRESRFGKYLCCENFPKCRFKISLDADGKKIVPKVLDEKCEKCGSPMAVKQGWRGQFLACTAYPNCKNIIGLDREGNKIIRAQPKMTDKKCEKCGKPMLLRVGKRGPFLACSGFPKCRNIKKASASDA